MQRLTLTVARLRTGPAIYLAAFTLLLSLPVALQAYPSISQFSPAYGAPGAVVTLVGSGFTTDAKVFFNDVPAVTATIVSSARISAVVPTNATTGYISVVSWSGTGYSSQEFTVAPRLTSYSPNMGAPGDSITILGDNFIRDGTVVKFGETAALVAFVSSKYLEARVPTGAKTGKLSVSTFAGVATSIQDFTVVNPGPTIVSFTPSSGAAGEDVVIRGLKFLNVSAVRFNGVNADSRVVTDSLINATVPKGASSGPISIVAAAGTAFSETHFKVITAAPAISSFTPTVGVAGATVSIRGTNFTQNTQISIGGVAADPVKVLSDMEIEAGVGAGAQTGPIVVTTVFGKFTTTQSFTVSRGLEITGFLPASGSVGGAVTIYGYRFSQATSVLFGSIAASFATTSDTTIQTTVPASAITAPISVVTTEGTATSTNSFVVIPAQSAITTFSPKSGGSGTLVTIEGAHLSRVVQVTFGAVAAAFSILSDTRIQAIVPTGAVSGPLAISSPDGNATSAETFSVASRITSITPTSGTPGTVVTLNGANFDGATEVTFNGQPALTFTVVSSVQMTAVVPPTASSGPVTVTTPAGISVSAQDFVVAATILGFSPIAGASGTLVEISGAGFAGATKILFNGTLASFTLVSGSRIQALVPAGATTGPITVTTPAGSATSSTAFTVAASGDLSLSMTDIPAASILGNPITYILLVSNAGPAKVTSVVVTNHLPAGANFLSGAASQGTVSETNGVVAGQLGALAPGAVARCWLTLSPGSGAVITNTASVSGEILDPSAGDNLATVISQLHYPTNLNLVRNGGAEAGEGAGTGTEVVFVPGWQTVSNLNVIQYGVGGGFPSQTSFGPTNRGVRFFAGGPTNVVSGGTQSINLTPLADVIDDNRALFTMDCYLGGSGDQNDRATFQAMFQTGNDTALVTHVLGPVTATDRTNTTGLISRSLAGRIPSRTRQVEFLLQMIRASGAANDAFADNLSFVIAVEPQRPDPRLEITRGDYYVTISWPASYTNMALEVSDMVPPIVWARHSLAPIRVGDRFVRSTQIDQDGRFYRLHRQ